MNMPSSLSLRGSSLTFAHTSERSLPSSSDYLNALYNILAKVSLYLVFMWTSAFVLLTIEFLLGLCLQVLASVSSFSSGYPNRSYSELLFSLELGVADMSDSFRASLLR